jgi:glycerol-3-phosphate dehydrogenase (NAD(P)+)
MGGASSRILVLGYGEMGHAMEQLLRPRHALVVWQRRPPPGTAPVDLPTEAARADFVLFCLPAAPHHDVAQRLAPHLGADTVCVTLAKGLDDEGRTATQALAAAFKDRRTQAVLYGPMIAEEIRAGRPAFACAGSENPVVAHRTVQLFANSALRPEPAADVVGLSWCGVLKNVYALLFGIADGLALGDNVRGYLAMACARELGEIVAHMGGRRESAHGLAGLGDLVTTATSASSRHHELGQRLARGDTHDLVSEGVHTLQVLARTRPFDAARFPLFRLAGDCVRSPHEAGGLVRRHFEML